MLGMHPIFTLFGTSPDMTTAAGAANYARQLTTEAGLAVMLALVASTHVLNTARPGGRHGWSGQARP